MHSGFRPLHALLERGVDPIDIGQVVGVAVDQLTTRLIELHVQQVGEPPASFAWMALGSAARHEQALTTDQDHAISYGSTDDVEAIDPYFARLATFVTDGLEACGITRCRGNVMAENPAWRRTVDGWRHRFTEYMTDPDIMGTRITNIAFDYRRVTGPVDIEPALDEVIRGARNDRSFVRRLVATVLESRPPLGRFRDVVVERGGEHPGTVDIKHGGITAHHEPRTVVRDPCGDHGEPHARASSRSGRRRRDLGRSTARPQRVVLSPVARPPRTPRRSVGAGYEARRLR